MAIEFMLKNKTAVSLYSKVKDLPIFDYHCHLSPKEIYEDRVFHNLTELWLEADHYKWRVMRIAGVSEDYITGNKPDYEKFYKFCEVLPNFIGNPVYHWAHMELKKYFNIDLAISKDTAKEIWDKSLEVFNTGSISAAKLVEGSRVDTVVTTDDPIDDLQYHKLLKGKYSFYVLPCFRPDKVINIEKPEFAEYIASLAKVSSTKIASAKDVVSAIEKRLDYFISMGATASDCSFKDFPNLVCPTEENATIALTKRLEGKDLTSEEIDNYMFYIIKNLAKMFNSKDITMQLHVGVVRNQNTARYNLLGADCGIDSVANPVNTENLGRLLDSVEQDGGVPKMIVYSLNNNDYYAIATMIGNFAGKNKGRLQIGAAWWFMDHRDGIEEQLKTYCNTMGLGYFNGMLTDSRSFVSYARHDYFRRILCSVIGEFVENYEYPYDNNLEQIVKNICYYNAKNNFGKKEDI